MKPDDDASTEADSEAILERAEFPFRSRKIISKVLTYFPLLFPVPVSLTRLHRFAIAILVCSMRLKLDFFLTPLKSAPRTYFA